jgi:CHASE2 domain
MGRPSLWLMLVFLLLGILFLREPRLERSEEIFLHWLVKNSEARPIPVPLTIVDMSSGPSTGKNEAKTDQREKISPLECALFLQAALEFRPTVVALEPVLNWPESSEGNEQVVVDQAMRVPKLLLGTDLTATPDPEAPVAEISGFPQVTGKRGDLVEFSGIAQQPAEDLRLISTPGFINLPKEVADEIHVPLLFQYRGEVIPSFALQAALLWLRVTPAEVKIDIGSSISLPNGHKIPIRSDGTILINPSAANRALRLSLNELLLAAQQHEKKNPAAARFEDIRDHIVLAGAPADFRPPSNAVVAAIATIQTNSFVRRVSGVFDCVLVVIAAGLSATLRKFSRIDLLLGAIAFSAAYCLTALGILSRWSVWLPGFLPLGTIWIFVLFALILPKRKDATRTLAIVAPPPAP